MFPQHSWVLRVGSGLIFILMIYLSYRLGPIQNSGVAAQRRIRIVFWGMLVLSLLLALADAFMQLHQPRTPLIGQLGRALAYPPAMVVAGYFNVKRGVREIGYAVVAMGLIWAVVAVLLVL